MSNEIITVQDAINRGFKRRGASNMANNEAVNFQDFRPGAELEPEIQEVPNISEFLIEGELRKAQFIKFVNAGGAEFIAGMVADWATITPSTNLPSPATQFVGPRASGVELYFPISAATPTGGIKYMEIGGTIGIYRKPLYGGGWEFVTRKILTDGLTVDISQYPDNPWQ